MCLEFQNSKEASVAGVEQKNIVGVEVIKTMGLEQRDRTL